MLCITAAIAIAGTALYLRRYYIVAQELRVHLALSQRGVDRMLAEGAVSVCCEPCVDALEVEVVVAGEVAYLLAFLVVAQAYGAPGVAGVHQPGLVLCGREGVDHCLCCRHRLVDLIVTLLEPHTCVYQTTAAANSEREEAHYEYVEVHECCAHAVQVRQLVFL